MTAGIHARECYSALVVLRQVETAVRFPPARGGAYFVPLVNPDGALFFESGEGMSQFPVLAAHAAERERWKANAEGVDLNTNFDANWACGKSNKLTAGASDFVGCYPLCAPESRALADFTLKVRPAATVSYHCMGGELYWEFFQTERRARDFAIASAVADRIEVKRVDGHLFSAGGYKDYCVNSLHIPAITVELIRLGSHPFGPEAYLTDIELNADLPAFILGLLEKVNE